MLAWTSNTTPLLNGHKTLQELIPSYHFRKQGSLRFFGPKVPIIPSTWGHIPIAIFLFLPVLASLSYFNCLFIEVISVFCSFYKGGQRCYKFSTNSYELVCAAWRDVLRIMLGLWPNSKVCLPELHYLPGEARRTITPDTVDSQLRWRTAGLPEILPLQHLEERLVLTEHFTSDRWTHSHRSWLHNNLVRPNLQLRSWSPKSHLMW